MDIAKQAVEIVQNAERRLLELAGNALTGGDYKSLRVAELARALGELAHSTGLNGENGESAGLPVQIPRKTGADSVSAASSRPRRAPRKGEYPKFFRRGDTLIKIGWSKKDRAEYEHKASRRVLNALASAITSRQGKGRVFTSDELLPLKDPDDGSEIPGYQAYVALAWLKVVELIRQHGRRGYSVRNGSQLVDAMAAAWQELTPASE